MLAVFSFQEFNDEVQRAIDGAVYSMLGESGLRSLHNHLKAHYGITSDEIPYRLNSLLETLDRIIGVREARRLGIDIARRVYYRYNIDFMPIEGYGLQEYLEQAKRVLSQLSHPPMVLKA